MCDNDLLLGLVRATSDACFARSLPEFPSVPSARSISKANADRVHAAVETIPFQTARDGLDSPTTSGICIVMTAATAFLHSTVPTPVATHVVTDELHAVPLSLLPVVLLSPLSGTTKRQSDGRA
jgi:hypothetical protein